MRKTATFITAFFVCLAASAQSPDMFRTIPSDKYISAEYSNGNKYQKDAIIFLDVIAGTHPFYARQDRQEQLLSRLPALYEKCGSCASDESFTELLREAIPEVHDKHTDVMAYDAYLKSRNKAAEPSMTDSQSDAPGSPMEYRKEPFWYELFAEESICYLQFNQCNDARTLKDASLPRFDETLYRMFNEMEEAGISTLVVDAQYNGGGSSRLCSELIDMIFPYSDLKSWKNYIRFSDLLAMYSPKTAEARKKWEESGHGQELYLMPEKKQEVPDHDRFRGRTVFIQGPKTFSSAGILMTDVRDNGIALIIGTSSTYTPSHYGEVLPFKLPNTDVLGSVCTKYFERPDTGKAEEKTLEPDIRLELSDKAAAWEYILKEFGTKKQ